MALTSLTNKIKTNRPNQVSADRFNFLVLSDAEPNLGVPGGSGYFLRGHPDGTRYWAPFSANTTALIRYDYVTATATTRIDYTTPSLTGTFLQVDPVKDAVLVWVNGVLISPGGIYETPDYSFCCTKIHHPKFWCF
jgi:hypothetical protein